MTSSHPQSAINNHPASAATPGDPAAPSRKSHLLRAMARASAGMSIPLAGRRFFPLWGIIRYSGRRSGRSYATPVVVQRTRDGFLIPMPFGDATQWARNILAAGGVTIRWRAGEYRSVDPEVIDWRAARSGFPPLLRAMIPMTGIRTFMRVRAEEPSS
jgi:deazaflavin-dependent oxidoreductase (nitroreductase family)